MIGGLSLKDVPSPSHEYDEVVSFDIQGNTGLARPFDTQIQCTIQSPTEEGQYLYFVSTELTLYDGVTLLDGESNIGHAKALFKVDVHGTQAEIRNRVLGNVYSTTPRIVIPAGESFSVSYCINQGAYGDNVEIQGS